MYNYVNGSPIERFTAKYKVDGRTGCWVWQAALWNEDGYGTLGIKENGKWKRVGAHRFSYEHYKGLIPKGLYVCHTCDNPSCVNPEHLFLGTQTDNMSDCKRKGRRPSFVGEKNPNSKLKSKDVALVYYFRNLGLSSKEIAEKLSETGITSHGIRSMWRRNLKQA